MFILYHNINLYQKGQNFDLETFPKIFSINMKKVQTVKMMDKICLKVNFNLKINLMGTLTLFMKIPHWKMDCLMEKFLLMEANHIIKKMIIMMDQKIILLILKMRILMMTLMILDLMSMEEEDQGIDKFQEIIEEE